jgi:hypothetical protein
MLAPLRRTTLAIALATLASACGGGGGGGGSSSGGGGPDTTPPGVVSFSPANNAQGVSRTPSVQITFSEALDPASVTASTVTLTGPGGALPVAVTLSADKKTVTLAPSVTLDNYAQYTVAVTTAVKDAAGNAVVSPMSAVFRTADTVAPAVPAAPNVPAYANIASSNPSISWVAPLDDGPGVVSYDVEVQTTGGAAVYSGTVNGTSVSIGNQSARDGQSLVARVRARDAFNNVSGYSAWSAPIVVDVTRPTVTSSSPANNAQGLSRTPTVQISFSEALDPASVTGASATLTGPGGAVSASLSLSADQKVVTVSPAATLDNYAQYTVAVTTAVKDVAGNALAAPMSAVFRTADTVAPNVPAAPTVPAFANLASPNPTVSWSAVTDDGPGVASYDLEVVTSPGGAPVYSGNVVGSTSVAIGNQSARDGQSLVARVAARDAAGNASAFSPWSSPIVVDVTAPTATLAPPNGANGVARNAAIQVTFSEPMKASTLAGAVTLTQGGSPVGAPGTLTGNVLAWTYTAPLALYAQHVLSVSTAATDLAGNPIAAAQTATFQTADDQKPPTPAAPTVPAYANIANPNPTVSWSAVTDQGSGVASYDVEVVTSPGGAPVYSGSVVGSTSVAIGNQSARDGQSLVARVAARDQSGNVSDFSAWSSPIVVDVTAPTAMLDPANGVTGVARNAAISVVFTEPMKASTLAGAVTLTQGGTSVGAPGTLSGTTLPVTHGPLANYALHVLSVSAAATDLAGNPVATTLSTTFRTTDDVAPPIPNAPVGPTYANVSSPDPQFLWSAVTDDGSGVASYQLEVVVTPGGAPVWSGVVSGTAKSIGNQSALDGRSIVARVAARDLYGNASTFGAWSAPTKVDVTAPAVGTVADAGAWTGPSVQFSWPASSDGSGIDHYEVRFATGVPSFGGVPDVVTSNPSVTLDASSYLDGVQIFASVVAVDGAGNVGVASVSDGVRLDKVAPGVPGTPYGPGAYALTSPVRFDWAAATDALSGVASYQVSAFTAKTAGVPLPVSHPDPASTFADVTASDGTTVYVQVTATDRAGNVGPVSAWSAPVVVDLTKPTKPGQPQRPAGAVLASPVAYTWTPATDASGIAWYEVVAMNGLDPVFSGTTAALGQSVAAADNQTITVKVRAVDRAGWVGDWSDPSSPVKVDAAGPSAPGQPSVPALTQASLHVTWPAATDAASTVQSYLVQVGTDATFSGGVFATVDAGNSTSTDVSVASRDGQTVFVRVAAVDQFAHQGAWSVASDPVIVDTSPPIAQGDPQDGGDVSASRNLHFYWPAYTDATSGVVLYECQFAEGPTLATKNPTGTVQVTSPACDYFASPAVGTYAFVKVRAKDAAGNWSAFGNWSDGIKVDPSAPGTPGKPVALAGAYSTSTTLQWTWSPPAGWNGATDLWIVHVGTTPGGSDVMAWASTPGAPPVYTYISGQNGVTYYLSVASKRSGVTGAFSSSSDGVMVDTAAPGVPGTPTLFAQSGSSVTFAWSPALDPESGVTAYEVSVYVNQPPTGGSPVLTQQTPWTSFTYSGAWSGAQVAMEVRAIDAAGNVGPWSTRSDPVTIDTTPPMAWSQTMSDWPQPTNVDLGVQFSKPMNRASVEAAFSVTWAGNQHPKNGYVFHWSADSKTLTVVPDTQDPVGETNVDVLPEATAFVMAIASTATDTMGNPLQGPISAPFTTRDETPPTLVSVVEKQSGQSSPFDPATVATSVTVIAQFSEEMSPTSASAELGRDGRWTNGGMSSAGISTAWTGPGSITYQLAGCGTLDLRAGDTVTVRDANPQEYQVTRAAVTAVDPLACKVTVAVASPPATAYQNGGWMALPSGWVGGMRFVWTGPQTLQVEVPDFGLSAGSDARLRFWNVNDLAWNTAQPEVTLQVLVTGDTTPPALVASIPSAGAANVEGAAPIRLRFSEPLRPTTVAGISASCPGCANLYDVRYGTDDMGPVVTLVPKASPPPSSAVTVHVPATVKDVAGNGAVVADVTFTTGAGESSAPQIRDTSPPVREGGVVHAVDNVWGFSFEVQDGATQRLEALDVRSLGANDVRVVDLSTGLLVRGFGLSGTAGSAVATLTSSGGSKGLGSGWTNLNVTKVVVSSGKATYTTATPHGMATPGAWVWIQISGYPDLSPQNIQVLSIDGPSTFSVSSGAATGAGDGTTTIGQANVPAAKSYEISILGIPGADGILDAHGNALAAAVYTLDVQPWANRVPYLDFNDLRLSASTSPAGRTLDARANASDADGGNVTVSLLDADGVLSGTTQSLWLSSNGGNSSYQYPQNEGGGPPNGTFPSELAAYGASGWYKFWFEVDDGLAQTRVLRDVWIWATTDAPLLASIADGGVVRPVSARPIVVENGGAPAFSWSNVDAAHADLAAVYVVALDGIGSNNGGGSFQEIAIFAPQASGSMTLSRTLEPDVYLWTVVEQKSSPGSTSDGSSAWALDVRDLPRSMFAVGADNRSLAGAVFAGTRAGVTMGSAGTGGGGGGGGSTPTSAGPFDAMGTWAFEPAVGGAAPVQANATLVDQGGTPLPAETDYFAYQAGKRFTMTQQLGSGSPPTPAHGLVGRGGTLLAVAQESQAAPGIQVAAQPIVSGNPGVTALGSEFAFVEMDAHIDPSGSWGGGAVGYATFDAFNTVSVNGTENDGTSFAMGGLPYTFDGSSGLVTLEVNPGPPATHAQGYLAGPPGAEFIPFATTDQPDRLWWLLAARARTWTGTENASLLSGVYRFAAFQTQFDRSTSTFQWANGSNGTFTILPGGNFHYDGASMDVRFSGDGVYTVDPAARKVTSTITTGPGVGIGFTCVAGPDADTLLCLTTSDPNLVEVLVLSRDP